MKSGRPELQKCRPTGHGLDSLGSSRITSAEQAIVIQEVVVNCLCSKEVTGILIEFLIAMQIITVKVTDLEQSGG